MKEKVKFAFHILAHPFDGFWDMKREKKGDIRVSLVILALVVVTDILSKQFTAFLFNFDCFLLLQYWKKDFTLPRKSG